MVGSSKVLALPSTGVPHQRLARDEVGQIELVLADEVGKIAALFDGAQVEVGHRHLVQHHVEHAEGEGQVSSGPDGDPLVGHGPLRAHPRVDHHQFHPPLHGPGDRPHAVGATRVGTQAAPDGQEVVGVFHVLLVQERAVDERGADVDRAQMAPALDVVGTAEGPAEGLVGDDVAPGGKSEAVGKPARVTPFRDLPHLGGHRVERLVPAYLHPTRVFVQTLLRVGALHGRLHPVGVVHVHHGGLAPVAELAAACRVLRVPGEAQHDSVFHVGLSAAPGLVPAELAHDRLPFPSLECLGNDGIDRALGQGLTGAMLPEGFGDVRGRP